MSRNVERFSVPLRMRPDLIVREQHSAGHHAWIVKDPVALRYFTFNQQEYAILNWLDGSRTLMDIRDAFEREFPPQRLTLVQLQGYLANLHENGLLLLDGADPSENLLESGDRLKRQERWNTWSNWLAIRFSGIDPQRLLERLYPRVAWCYSPWFLFVWFLSIMIAVALVIVNSDELLYQLPTLQEMASPRNLLWLTIAFVCVKVLHEFGHALTCKHYGGECHEMGVLLLVFAPCLYCNVTDSWMLQGRWQRIAVSLAGIFVELQLAALATFLWIYSQPGALHTMALNLIIVCSVGTVLFNGNPLLRYDGYFALADLIGIPNLWQESRAAMRMWLTGWFLRRPISVPPQHERQLFLAAYGVASLIYRVIVVVAIVLLLQRFLVPHGFGFVVPLLIISLLVAAAPAWGRSIARFWGNPGVWRQIHRGRSLIAASIALAFAGGFLAFPLPCQIKAPAMLAPDGAQFLYVATPGTLISAKPAGTTVVAGETVAQLDDAELRLEIVQLVGELRVAEMRIQSLETRLIDEPDAAAQLEVARERAADLRLQLDQRRQDQERLILKSTINGTVMEPPALKPPNLADDTLPNWTGTPLEEKNADCYLQRGTLFCLLGDPARHEAVVYVDENDVQFVRVDQAVRMQFSVAPMSILKGRVVEIASRDLEFVPDELAWAQDLESRADAAGIRRPLHTTYSVRVALDAHDAIVLNGSHGRAKISVQPQTLAQRLLRLIRRTLRVSP